MTQEEKAKAYERALAKARDFNFQGYMDEECLYDMFPELRESEDEKVRKEIIDYCHERLNTTYGALPNIETIKRWLAWLEKQSSVTKLNEEKENKLAKSVLISCATSFINYLDAHKYDGKMCVSNGECEDIENSFLNAMWDRLHRYYCKYIEKQEELPEGCVRKQVAEAKEALYSAPCQGWREDDKNHFNNIITWLISLKQRLEGK